MHVQLHYCDVTQFHGRSDALGMLLSDDERARAAAFYRASDRMLFSVGRAVLRTILSNWLQQPAEQIVIRTSPAGKPFVAAGPSFSLSHSGSMVLLGFASGGSVGVDVERVRALEDMPDLAQRCFSDAELSDLEHYESAERLDAFFRVWTRKEAVVKAIGLGMGIDLKGFSVSPGEAAENLLIDEPAGFRSTNGPWTVRSVAMPHGYQAAVCADAESLSIDASSYSLTSLF